MKAITLSAILAAALAAPTSLSAGSLLPFPLAVGAGLAAEDASLYADATRAINESRWSEAVGLFDRVAQMRGEHAEGALYWKAYAENKEGQAASALNTCAELRKKYPNSHWLDE